MVEIFTKLPRGRPRHDSIVVAEESLSKLEEATKKMEAAFPSLFMGLNVAQYRAFKTMYGKNDAGKIPDMVSIEFANGVGKSHGMILDIIGWTMGPEFLCKDEFPEDAIDFYDAIKPLRDKGQLSLRLVCVSDDMKAGGSVYELLKQIFPWAKITAQDNNKSYKQIDIENPSKPNIKNSITIKTFEQDEVSHSGSTCNKIWINEKLPENLFGETLGRIRSKEGMPDGTIAQFATLVDHAAYLDDLEDSQHFFIERARGHLYENCIGEEVTEEMAAEVWQEIGIQLERRVGERGFRTGGVLRRSKIEAMVDGWLRGCPHQLQARKSGRPISSGGRIWPGYTPDVHEVNDELFQSIPESWPMVMICDPHPARPDAVIWAVVTGSNNLSVIDEWPTYGEFGYYDKIKEKRFTITEKCDIWRRIESDKHYTKRICTRIGDPNRFREPNSEHNGILKNLYSAQGFDFYIDINDSLEYAHELVNQYFWYDGNIRRMSPNDPAAQPRLVVAKSCTNTRRAILNYARKSSRDPTKPISEQIDKKFACFGGLINYLVVWHASHPFSEIKVDETRATEYDLIHNSRMPKKMRKNFAADCFNKHGRKIHSYA